MSVIDVALRFSHNVAMVTHDEIREELIRRLETKQHTGADIARLLGIAPSRVTDMRKRERRVQQNEMTVLAEFFGMGAPEIEADSSSVVFIPVIGMAAAGAWREAITFPSYVVQMARRADCNQAFAVEVHGDSMDLILPERSWAVIDPDQRRLTERKAYLISNGNGEATIKRYRENPARFEPASRNPEHKPIYVGEHEITVIGRVVAFSSDEGL